MNGYDIDGVLNRGLIPEKPYIVISGRTVIEWDRTVKQIGINAPIYLRPYGKQNDRILAGIWKAEMITKFNIMKFYEDDNRQADIIRRYCPNCEIIMVRKGKIITV